MPNVSLLCEVPIEIRGNNLGTSVFREFTYSNDAKCFKKEFPPDVKRLLPFDVTFTIYHIFWFMY